ncbi:hypothetical protein PbJCM13498_00650 [Prolixibacter bellariivorans]|uniref:Transporter n=1 Tax=Prolixibacter bellariivorans TaxID=314319 RepID=A0A5M4ATJ7_9BACT|nr:TolC family protein [Prolixibacter bellariivorans]GET31202.1 hypothetical protein PbJCM13498_00650 [Prolixibacter bellariivorans]
MKRLIYIIPLLFVVVLLSQEKTSAQEALNNYLVQAAENNPGLKAKFNDYRASLQKVPQVGTLPDPQVMFGYFIQPVETRLGPQKAKISATQMFPWFGTLKARENVATNMAQTKYEAFEDARSKLFYDLRSNYFNLYFTGRSIAITKENLKLMQSFRKLALVKIEAGMASTVDEYRLQMEIGELKNQLAYLQDNYQTQQVAFNNRLNRDRHATVEIPDTLWVKDLPLNMQQIADSVSLQNHQVKRLDNLMAAYQAEQEAARKAGSPKFSIGFNYIFVGKGSMSSTDAGKDAFFPSVGITIPLYRRKYQAMIQEAEFKEEAATNQKLDKVNTLNSVLERANRDYRDAVRRVALFRRQLSLAHRSLNILESSYSTDGKNFEEVLRMERKVLKYALELDKARADRNASVAFIDYLMGK